MTRSLRRSARHFSWVLALCLAACDRRVEPYVAPADEPAPVDRPVRVPGLESPVPRASMPLGPPDGASGQRTGAVSGKPIRGTIRIAAGAQASGAVLFLIARAAGQPGPPLAVKRLPVGPFPLEFEIGPEDEMIQGRPWDGPIALSARIDSDGDPLTHSPSDLNAELDESVQPGAEGVDLELGSASSASSDGASGERTGAVSGKPIRGTIRVAPGAQPSGAVLFLIARSPGQPGPPLAVKRLPVGPFPLEFEIGPADEMIQGRPWEGLIALSARVDSDGDPMTHSPADASAELADPVEPGAEGVDLELAPASR